MTDLHSKISVIMTTLNSARFITEAVESILNQTYQNWEMIVVDGGSTDGTTSILRKYTDSRIHIFECEGLGRSAQLNYAMDQISGEYVAIMDSDDISLPNRLELEYQYLKEHPDVTILGSWGRSMSEEGEIKELRRTPLSNNGILENLMTPMLVIFSSVMFRKILCNIKFDENIKKNVDIEWYSRISDIAYFANIPIPLFNIRKTKGSLSRKGDIENNKLLTEAFERTCALKTGKPLTVNERYLLNLWQGIVHYYYGSQDKAKKFLAAAINTRHERIIAWRYYLPVLLLPPRIFKIFRENIFANFLACGVRSLQLLFFKNKK
jgi:glycosyltransferase involved in cell wall biosynthesis